MAKLATIYGGSGFVGRYIAQKLAADGWRVRVAVRRPNEAMHVKPYGVPGQVEPVLCNIRDDASVAAVMKGADAVINCVGTFDARGRNNFEAVQHEGAERVAKAAAAEGVANMVHISALGVDADADSQYAESKRVGEEGVLKHFPNATILRPSVIFGIEDGFFNRFAAMSRFGPIMPIFGGKTRFQPVYVEDVAMAAVMGAEGKAQGTYELGGPEVKPLSEWVGVMLDSVHRFRLVPNLPLWIGRIVGWGFDVASMATFSLFSNKILTRDQVKQLRHDNVVSQDAKSFADLGIEPVAAEAVIDSYLWRYRPNGQFDAIRDSAKNLRAH
ncbi:complex I NDUFA9 subunit family protein [Alisedimentitalea sp. MJ-SS2]|uniref:complex I NDUFA9 subunit family protein n=1 Tax=Aliisedimentitalea sp. MJ-SS2 TaxID=3049795 RepID=UPI00290AD183|nr:complex I NDUFA9 subunit family protein [Alisedimentitalea sp. MJ-SS2]MDU8927996.1 complex I NDUFA9 subunit family protein [Alisedimentitalea sp. MJ-SS2]